MLLYALFCAVGTDIARRVVGGGAVVCGAVALARAAAAFGSPLLGGLAGAAPGPRRTVLTDPAFWLLAVGAGVVATGVVNGLTWYFAHIRANQPATAMLY